MDKVLDAIRNFRHQDVLFALAIIGLLAVLMLPMPPWVLDMGIAVSIALSSLILMVALWIHKPLDFSSFPTILLVATLVRLSLNLASTRLILANGHEGDAAAGYIIRGFANFVMGGEFLIGIIVFLILVLVNFVVITKGAGRIAEVTARFSLDSMPGKQMAIDADLSNGLITEQEAKDRRKELEDESAFFGSMDGASKFVRGDAIAGLIIVFVNLVGGVLVGASQHGMSISQALESYAILTVGDGLVSQIPALVVSLAAGMLVSKGAALGSADKAVFGQLGGNPKAMSTAAGLLVVLGLVPGLPALPFFLLAAALGGLAYMAWRKRQEREEQAAAEEAEAAKPQPREERTSDYLQMEELSIHFGEGLLRMISGDQGQGHIGERIKRLRRRLAGEYGFVMPNVTLRDAPGAMPENRYSVLVQNVEVDGAELRMDKVLAIGEGVQNSSLPGETTTEPTFGLPAKWISKEDKEEAEDEYFVVTPDTVVVTHFGEVVKNHMPHLLTYAAAKSLLDEVPSPHRKTIDDLVPGVVKVVTVRKVMAELLKERVSIRNLPAIVEAIGELGAGVSDVQQITEYVRNKLSLQISRSVVDPNEKAIVAIQMSRPWEEAFQGAIDDQGALALAPNKTQDFVKRAREVVNAETENGRNPVVLVSKRIRPFVKDFMSHISATTPVIAYEELDRRVSLKTVGQI